MAKAKASRKGGARSGAKKRSSSSSQRAVGARGTTNKRRPAARGVASRSVATPGRPGAVGTRPTASHRPTPRKAKRQLPNEKAVADTDRTFSIEPERIAPGKREPMPDAALDRRRHIVGTDDPGDATAQS